MASLHPLQIELVVVKQKLNQAEADLRAGTLTSDGFTALTNFLRAEKADLEDKLERAMTPTVPTPALAPPGNAITLPQVLPLASFLLSSPSSEFASSTNYN